MVEHLSEEQQVHRDLLLVQRDDRAREMKDLRRDVERQRQQLSDYEQTVEKLRSVVDDLLTHNNSLLHPHTSAKPILPIGMFTTDTLELDHCRPRA